MPDFFGRMQKTLMMTEGCDGLFEAVNSIVGRAVEGNFKSFTVADTDSSYRRLLA